MVLTSRMLCSHCTCKVSSSPEAPLVHLPTRLFHSLASMLSLCTAGVHAAMVVADLTDLRSFVDIGRWMTHFTSATSSASLPFPVLLLANKADSHDRVLSDTSVSEWADKHRLTHSYVISAKTGTGVEEAFRSLVPRIEKFVPAAQSAAVSSAVGGGGSLDATQRLLSLLHSGAAVRRSPSHSPSPSHRPSASLTPTSRTRASSLLSVQSLLSSLPPSASSRMQPPSASPRAAVSSVGRLPGLSYSALAVQRLTAAGSHHRAAAASLSTLGRQEAKERDSSRSGSRVEEKEWIGERKQLLTASSSATPIQSAKPSLTIKPAMTASDGMAGKRPLYSPSTKEVDLRF